MKTWIVSYADASFHTAQRTLSASARRFGIDVIREWTRGRLQQTAFYEAHRQVLDRRRGSGYWLWKPFIISETLREMAEGDLLIYSDAGIAIVADLGPVLSLCREGRDIVLFANHYREAGGNDCGTWTKRDCFVLMDCDTDRFHDGAMTDASFLMVRKSAPAVAFVHDWLSYACRSELLTDVPTSGPLPDLPRFIDHRHDQSILSLLAIRDGVELFRHPSQQGNHVKDVPLRQPGEWTRFAYATEGLFRNSPYGTLLHHHRGALGQPDLRVSITRRVAAPCAEAFAAWTQREILTSWRPADYVVTLVDADVRLGGRYELVLRKTQPGLRHAHIRLTGEYVDVRRPERLVYTAPAATQVIVQFTSDDGIGLEHTTVALEHGCFATEAARERYAEFWTSFLEHFSTRLTAHG